MPMSGNVGDTLNALPVLSGIYKSTGHSILLVLNDKMKIFTGVKDLLLRQECILNVEYRSEVNLDSTYNILSLVDNFTQHTNRPWETVRLEEYFRLHYNIDFEVDDNFILDVPDVDVDHTKIYIGDRMSHSDMDQRRKFNVLESSGKFKEDCFVFLDYNTPMHINAGIVAKTPHTFFSTFTGISVIADLLNKPQVVLWGNDLYNWDGKPIEYSFNKHFYRDRKSQLKYLGDFNYDEVIYEIQQRDVSTA